MSNLPLASLGTSGGFISDPRFLVGEVRLPESRDPLSAARAEGYAAGQSDTRAELLAAEQADEAARSRVEYTLGQLEIERGEVLRQRLFAVVAALCEASIAPLALDRDALIRRATAAAAMLSRADDNKVLRLHPDDLVLVADQLPADLETLSDQTLERGALRIETSAGGVEDGPAHWRRAIAQALAQC